MGSTVGAAPRFTSDSAAPRWLICFSHLRWNFVYQRPQHLLSRAAQSFRVVIWEEPEFGDAQAPTLRVQPVQPMILIATPLLPRGMNEAGCVVAQRRMLDFVIAEQRITAPLLWYYTPQALPFSDHLRCSALVYDCMDELSAFRGADPLLPLRERDLLARADLVFTGGFSLYEVKRQQHRSVHPFPSGVDVAHFLPARADLPEPPDQAGIPHPRLGFYGVLDERLDRELLAMLADARPDWQFVMIGPTVKVDPTELPRRPNIHYLGGKQYAELPSYISSWDVALILFARNEATRFISPTKTPEYLAAGLPVVSTPIVDVVRHYGKSRAVAIAGTAAEFVKAAEHALLLRQDPASWLPEADQLLASAGWDSVWERMSVLIAEAIARRTAVVKPRRALKRVSGPAKSYDTLVVGAGFAGSVIAERLASSGNRVLLLDRRPHAGGNAYDQRNEAGVLIHRYGPHIFHTNSRQIVDYLGRFTEWRPYEHRVLACVRDSLLPIPINRTTINRFFGLSLAEAEVAGFLASKAAPIAAVRTAADVVLSTVGRELYEAFFQGYTRKQWGVDPSDLDKSVTARIPTRTGDDDRYFTDKYQVMPRHGFTQLFENMLDHPNITLMLGADYRDVQHDITWTHLVYTGPVDEYFDHRYGKLPYRSLRFEHRTVDQPNYQPVAVVNYPSQEVPYTRVTEFKHLTGQAHPKTSICYEFPTDAGDPYYPVPRPDNAVLYAKYQALADATPEVTFVGRLATYRYYNMDQVVGQALATFERLSARAKPVTGNERRRRDMAAGS